jgi:hypothetical protein
MDAGLLETAENYYGAALLFQHGRTPADFALARALAERAAALGHPKAKRLAALAEDRYLVRMGKPQRCGTQFSCTSGQGWRLDPVDSAVSDAERVARGVDPLPVMQSRIVQLNAATHRRCGLSRQVIQELRTMPIRSCSGISANP